MLPANIHTECNSVYLVGGRRVKQMQSLFSYDCVAEPSNEQLFKQQIDCIDRKNIKPKAAFRIGCQDM